MCGLRIDSRAPSAHSFKLYRSFFAIRFQVAAFRDVDVTLRSDLRKTWQAKIDAWLEDRSQPNPYEIEEGKDGDNATGPTEAAIRLMLTSDKARDAASGGRKLHGSSVTSFLVAGLQLEDSQRHIQNEAKGRTLLMADHTEKVAEMRIAFFTKLRSFWRLQVIYMPAAIHQVEEEEDQRDTDLPAPKAEDIHLYLPSGLAAADREDDCRAGLSGMETKLREGQCHDGLRSLRSRLHAKRHMLTFRDDNVVGQRVATRAFTLLERIGEQVDAAAAKYRRGREVLIALWGGEKCAAWKELKLADVQLDEEREIDARSRQKLGRINSSRFRRNGPALSSTKKKMLWIWTAGGGPGENEEALHDSVQVEWSKAKARKDRWEEEIALLREEMKHVLRLLRWRSVWWEGKQGARREGVSAELRNGIEAYAARQAAFHGEVARRFKTAWNTSVATAVRMAVQEDSILTESMSVFGGLTDGGGGGEGEGWGAGEGEGEGKGEGEGEGEGEGSGTA
ncbi:hypothetical protein DFH09DRAFT_1104333 [Mycena vulgaris]|nr:hypothetical protein DFH09DRAFT_1104333 [Mycena vulgaris]